DTLERGRKPFARDQVDPGRARDPHDLVAALLEHVDDVAPDPAGGSCDCDTHGAAPFVRVLLVDERGAPRGTGRERSGIARQPRPDLEVVAEVLLEPDRPEDALADVAAALGDSLRRI